MPNYEISITHETTDEYYYTVGYFELCVMIICGMNETEYARVYGLILGQTPTKLQGDYRT